MAQPPARQVRATFDDDAITVYQAYPHAIADAAVGAGTFVAPFKVERMTWVKPSFLWMMYRSGWATKPGQERVLAVRITRAGFEEALSLSCLSHYDRDVYPDRAAWEARKRSSPVRVQWDPERSPTLSPQPWRSLQVGLEGVAVQRYVEDWIVGISDVTAQVHDLRHAGVRDPSLLPLERPYPLPDAVARVVGASGTAPSDGPAGGLVPDTAIGLPHD